MVTTTTAFTACDAVIELDNGAGTLTDISGSSNSVDVNFDNQIGEFRVFGTQWMSRVQCGKDATISIKGIATTATDEIRDIIENWFFTDSNTSRTFNLSMPGNSVGDILYACEVVLSSWKFSGDSSSADPVMYDIELLPNGAVTRSVIT
jgi:hypothetical protein